MGTDGFLSPFCTESVEDIDHKAMNKKDSLRALRYRLRARHGRAFDI
jgi:hypothetical protein